MYARHNLKINCDAAFDSLSRRGGIGVVIRDWKGEVVCCHNLVFMGDDVVAIEGQAVFHALLAARRMSFESLVVETDCVVLFKALGEAVSDSPCTTASLVGDLLFLRDSFCHCSFALVARSANKAADWTAKRALEAAILSSGDVSSQPGLVSVLMSDLSLHE